MTMQKATAGTMPPSDSEEETSSEESDSGEERQPVRKARPAVPDEPPKRYISASMAQSTAY